MLEQDLARAECGSFESVEAASARRRGPRPSETAPCKEREAFSLRLSAAKRERDEAREALDISRESAPEAREGDRRCAARRGPRPRRGDRRRAQRHHLRTVADHRRDDAGAAERDAAIARPTYEVRTVAPTIAEREAHRGAGGAWLAHRQRWQAPRGCAIGWRMALGGAYFLTGPRRAAPLRVAGGAVMDYTDDEIESAVAAPSQSAAAKSGVTRMQLRRRCIACGIEMPRGKGAPYRLAVIAGDIVRPPSQTGSVVAAAKAIGISQTVAYQRLRESWHRAVDDRKGDRPKRGRRRVSVTVDELRRAVGPRGGACRCRAGISQSTAYQMLP